MSTLGEDYADAKGLYDVDTNSNYMEYGYDQIERLEYNEQQQCFHRADTDEPSVPNWQTVGTAHPAFIDKFRLAHVDLRGSFSTIQQAFDQFRETGLEELYEQAH